MKVKICGLTSQKEAGYVSEAGADFAGMVLFVPKSKRNISIDRAKEIMGSLDPSVSPVAVLISPDEEQIRAVEDAGFSYIQIHGPISDELLDRVHVPVIKAFNGADISDLSHYTAHPAVCGALFDAAEPGSGKTFDWNDLSGIQTDGVMKFIAGGLTPENVARALAFTQADGVDVSTGVEKEDGCGKSREKILRFVSAARGV